MLLFCVLMGRYADAALPPVLRRIIGPRAAGAEGATAGAWCQARHRLGARPVVARSRSVCRPLATAATPSASLFGRRRMALAGITVERPDTPANVRAFGRRRTPRGRSAWPQAPLVLPVECGTRAVRDAGVRPGRVDERRAGRRLRRSVGPGTPLLRDRGFRHVAMAEATEARGADFLGRLPATVTPLAVRASGDGTALVRRRARDSPRRRHGAHVVVRRIRSTPDDPQRPGHRVEQRLVTPLRDPAVAPARDPIPAYHRRRGIESALDELKTHRRPARPLRSRKPIGVVQGIDGLPIAHYPVRAALGEAAAEGASPPLRLRFLGALRLIRDHVPRAQHLAARAYRRPNRQLRQAIAAQRRPRRAERGNPRVVKQQMAAHRRWPQPTKPFADAIVLLI